MTEKVKADSLVTLHYRLASGNDQALVSTFDGTPATLQLGNGELVPTLEACLEGLAVGEHHTFLLEAEQAFGPHSPELVQRLSRADLPADGNVEVFSMIEFSGPDGMHIAGLVRELDADSALIDFNHPLAGRDVRFEVEIVGIL
ncbi:MAG: FKBP-type peptidyl-prolyl cis-trans isomerase [Rhodocyclales bacterium]|nr:FKBP-type peptidyl-prolyl cis-trans isomerase [Rhodocyclales bacterium]